VSTERRGVRESEKHWDFDRLRDLAHRYDISTQSYGSCPRTSLPPRAIVAAVQGFGSSSSSSPSTMMSSASSLAENKGCQSLHHPKNYIAKRNRPFIGRNTLVKFVVLVNIVHALTRALFITERPNGSRSGMGHDGFAHKSAAEPGVPSTPCVFSFSAVPSRPGGGNQSYLGAETRP